MSILLQVRTRQQVFAHVVHRSALPLFERELSNIETKTLRSWPISAHIEAREEIWTAYGTDPTPINAAYATATGDYIGDVSFGKFLAGKCIRPERRLSTSSVCSIGYSKPLGGWAGWSHRALCVFKIGDRVFDPDYGDDNTPYIVHGGVVIVNDDQCKQSACNFAAYVS